MNSSFAVSSAVLLPRLGSDLHVRSAHALVTRDIALKILRGDYPQDTLLPQEADLIEEYCVSRTALRESIRTLAAKGFLVSKTKIGTRVMNESFWNMYDPQVLTWRVELGVDSSFLLKIFEVRQALEPMAAALAAMRRTRLNLRHMKAYLDGMSALSHTRESYAEPDLGFHQEVLLASGNPFMQGFSSVIDAAIRYSFRISAPVDTDERLHTSIERHSAVFEAIEAQDAGRASAAMTQVIRESIENAHYEFAAQPVVVTMPLGGIA